MPTFPSAHEQQQAALQRQKQEEMDARRRESIQLVLVEDRVVEPDIMLRDDGTVECWGVNSSGQCNVPAALTDPATAGVVAVAAGNSHSVALKAFQTM